MLSVTSAALQAEQRASVPNQVKFDIASATVELEVAFTFFIRRVFAFCHNRQIRCDIAFSDRLDKIQAGIENPSGLNRQKTDRPRRVFRYGVSSRNIRHTIA